MKNIETYIGDTISGKIWDKIRDYTKNEITFELWGYVYGTIKEPNSVEKISNIKYGCRENITTKLKQYEECK